VLLCKPLCIVKEGVDRLSIPRIEHPRPQFQRERWINLNGQWDFCFDPDDVGFESRWELQDSFDLSITVPFPPESMLSGIRKNDYVQTVWYGRSFSLPPGWISGRFLIHFGAVDYQCCVWINGKELGRHYGGSSPFTFDLTDYLLGPGQENRIVLRIYDDVRSGVQPAGKQSVTDEPEGVKYERITGIWQTVWLENVPDIYLKNINIVTDLDGGRLLITPELSEECSSLDIQVEAISNGERAGVVSRKAFSGVPVEVILDMVHPWSPEDPHLYDLCVELQLDDETIDVVSSYAGLRKFHIEANKFFLNNEPIFLRLVLDQGFYRDGLWTAPTDDDLRLDIERSMQVGFNGARLHQKAFEPRFHYWADKLGYLTWGEFPDWGLDISKPMALFNYLREWSDIVKRDRNHPSIIVWTPFNETWQIGALSCPQRHSSLVNSVYEITKVLDSSRPVHDTSGFVHVRTDIYSVHDYEQNVEEFALHYESVNPYQSDRAFTGLNYPRVPNTGRKSEINASGESVAYDGQPYVVAEFGGTWWDATAGDIVDGEPTGNSQSGVVVGEDRRKSWGYGRRPLSIDEVYDRISGLIEVVTNHPHIAGYCYTQLTDVRQERNGIYTYDRKLKFEIDKLRAIFQPSSAAQPDAEANH
tara:strand:- start:7326 stop:9254 length:1929 start_codon:yes stop_codon:yes gene_type:complete